MALEIVAVGDEAHNAERYGTHYECGQEQGVASGHFNSKEQSHQRSADSTCHHATHSHEYAVGCRDVHTGDECIGNKSEE